MRRLLAVIAGLAMLAAMVPATALANPAGSTAAAYVTATGQHIQGAFLEFWETRGGPDIFGYPITEEISQGGATVQYFQRARMELRGDQIQLALLGDELGKGQPKMANPPSTNTGADWQYFPETGHLVAAGFLRHFRNTGGVEIYGYPISAEVTENGRTVQYFQRARMEWTGAAVQLGNIGDEVAAMRGVQLGQVPQREGAVEWEPRSRPAFVNGSNGPGAPRAVGKVIYLSLADQHLWAYENGSLVVSTPITTGAPLTPTLPGDFRIQSKHTPFLFVSPWGVGDFRYYDPAWTTYAMLYAAGGYYIHDAPWRIDYGPGTTTWHQGSDGQWRQGSHGCVNVPFAAMEALFRWSDLATEVVIR